MDEDAAGGHVAEGASVVPGVLGGGVGDEERGHDDGAAHVGLHAARRRGSAVREVIETGRKMKELKDG